MTKAKDIPIDYLKECLEYKPETGEFFWKERPLNHFKNSAVCMRVNNRYAGKRAGQIETTVSGYKYWAVKVSRIAYKQHRLAWAFVNGSFEGLIDHINRDSTDNRICNLRVADYSSNMFNTKLTPNNKCFGIRFKDSSWEVWFPVDGKPKYFGRFATEELAYEKRMSLEKEFNVCRGEAA